MSELLGTLLGFVLTVAVFSYILGDNPLFRLAVHLFIGVAAGYAAALAVFNVLLPQLILPMMADDTQRLFLLTPLVLCVLLLTKISRGLERLGNPSVGFLVGVGAAVTIGGSIVGTLFPQVAASTQTLRSGWGILNGAVVLVGTVSTLAYFHFGMRARGEEAPALNPAADALGDIGQVFIAITLGVIFVGVYLAALAAFIERIDVLLSVWQTLQSTL